MRAHATVAIGAIAWTCLVLALSATECRAVGPYSPAHPDPVLEQWRWRSYPELKGEGLQGVTEDRDGRMWFGVTDGVREYDGMTWVAH